MYLSRLHQHFSLLHRIPKEDRPIEIAFEDHRRRRRRRRRLARLILQSLTIQRLHFANLGSIHQYNINALLLQLLLCSWPSHAVVETHRHILNHVGFEPRA